VNLGPFWERKNFINAGGPFFTKWQKSHHIKKHWALATWIFWDSYVGQLTILG